ncbi:hypothetical protein SAMN02745157_4916 [Kaistia soli DSM 19436]|uniref:DUF3052 domain-containing protein n=1 Tax=Kaistia soli DSM 19436 TaxID=1122133 RepID=A0A1M5N4T5_9HYPH|nr:DUF3052 domain-containing protein [Kaistia soli]SHG84586.1 hypothetical protein SAMN02745157_4916 [Kaistia soli DSM 19436]
MTASLSQAGYSGRPLPDKLGLKAGMTVAFLALPDNLGALRSAAPFARVEEAADWSADLGAPRGFDAIHAFTTRQAEIDARLPALQDAIRRDGMIWVSWPKKASKVPTDVTEDTVRDAALALDLVDVKVAAIDPVWSGLKLMIRKDRR